MRHDNKTGLFKMLAESMTHLDAGKTTVIPRSLETLAVTAVNCATMQL